MKAWRSTGLLLVGLGMALVPLPSAASGAITAPLLPGELVGGVHVVKRPKGLSKRLLSSYYGVLPSHLEDLGDGKLRVDQRRIQPRFYPWVDGIVLNVPEAQVRYVEHARVVRSYAVGVSREGWPVPVVQTKVVEMRRNPAWYVPRSIQDEMIAHGEEPKEVVPPGPDNPLGTRWIGFYDGSYGFHGTSAPGSIKSFESHGCVRFLRPDIEDLFGRVHMGTPVRVYYQPVLMAVEGPHVWMASYPDVYGWYHHKLAPGALVRAIAKQAGVIGRLDWDKIGRMLTKQTGIVRDVALGAEG